VSSGAGAAAPRHARCFALGMARVARWALGALVLLVVVLVVVGVLIDEPLRRRMEADLTGRLEGYHVRLGGLDLSPFGFSLELKNLVVSQDAHPDPPVLRVPRLRASVQWRALLHAAVVADFEIDRPTVHLDLSQVEQEARDEVPVEQRGWQDAVTHIYPLEINALDIKGATVEYEDRGPLPPVRLTDLVVRAENIRNVRSTAGVYPSAVEVRAHVLDSAKLRARGRADFLAEPHPAVRLRFALDDVALRRLAPVLRHAGVAVRGGRLSTRGQIEYAPRKQAVELAALHVDDADLEYVKERQSQPGAGEETTKAAAKATQEPETFIRADDVRVRRTTVGYVDRTTDPSYRVFVSGCDVRLDRFANERVPGEPAEPSHLQVRGKFMDSGPLQVDARFQPRADRADFDLDLKIEHADVTTLNDLWRAYGKFDVAAGRFSLYSQLGVHDGQVSGYAKPIFQNLDVYASAQDAQKGIARQAYEAIVGGVATVLRNQPRDQVATETSLSGSLDDPNASTLQALGGIIRNAFFQAILPGLDRRR
jgi:hypothetical protein